VHDYFEIVGVPPHADAREIRQAGRRHLRVSHPDFVDGESGPGAGEVEARPADAAVDFAEMSGITSRMLAAFFTSHAAPR
jgi:hypothetical protein